VSASTGDLLTRLGGHDPVVIVFYRDHDSQTDLLELCELLAPSGAPTLRSGAVEDAFRGEYKNTILLVTPADEVSAVRTLDGRREQLLDREAPTILFLLQGGSAESFYNTDAPALASIVRGLTYDPEPPPIETDLARRRAEFRQKHDRTPSEWVRAWRNDELPDTADNNLVAHEAWTLRTR